MWKGHGSLLVLLITTSMSAAKLLPETKVESRFLGESRFVRVYLPPSYDATRTRRYPVLYLHDGQNAFTSAGPDCCFGWGNWELDRTADRLSLEGRMQEIIMVAVHHSDARYKEYRGRLHVALGKSAKASATKATNALDNTRFEAYANFLAKELKPRIDKEFRTLKTPANTGVLGSSLGGICSLSLGWEFPKVFGRVASLSGALQIEKRNFIERVVGSDRGKPRPVRIYLDSGTVDFTGDDDGRRNTDALAAELRRIGWKEGRNLMHFTDLTPLAESELERAGLRRDKWHEAQKSQHNEFYWRLRVWRALEFLFPPK